MKRALLVIAATACSGDPVRAPSVAPSAGSATAPARSDSAGIALEPQRPGDAKRGYEMLVNAGYVGCGVPRALWDRVGMRTPAAWKLDRARSDSASADLPYFMNAVAQPDGVEVITANCLGCHASFLRGKLVVGLGEASMDFSIDPTLQLAVAAMMLESAAERTAFEKLSSRMRALAPYILPRTVGANPADQIAAVLFAHRDPATARVVRDATRAAPRAGTADPRRRAGVVAPEEEDRDVPHRCRSRRSRAHHDDG